MPAAAGGTLKRKDVKRQVRKDRRAPKPKVRPQVTVRARRPLGDTQASQRRSGPKPKAGPARPIAGAKGSRIAGPSTPVAIRLKQKRQIERAKAVRAQAQKKKGRGTFATILNTLGNEATGKGVLRAGATAAGKGIDALDALKVAGVPATSVLRAVPGIGLLSHKLGRNAAKDAVSIPAEAIPSLYLPGREVVRGRPDKALEMLVAPYKELYKHPGRTLTEHPLNTALMVAGPYKGAARTAGRAAKIDTARPTQRVPGTALEGTTRRYSRDPAVKAVQVAGERRQARTVAKLKTRAAEAEKRGESRVAQDLLERAGQKDPLRMKDAEIKKRVDELVDLEEGRRRQERTRVTGEARQAAKGRGGSAVALRAQAITKPDRQDLVAYHDELKVQHATGDLTPVEKVANATARERLLKVIDDPKVNWADVETKAKAYRDLIEPMQGQLVKSGLLAEGQAARAKLVPYAVRNMEGVKPDSRLGAARELPDTPHTKALIAERDQAQALVKETLAESMRSDSPDLVGIHQLAKRRLKAAEKQIDELRQVPNREIVAHMEQAGEGTPAFITQAPGQRGARNFYKSFAPRSSIHSETRSGSATVRGTADLDPEVLVENAANMREYVSADNAFKSYIKEFGYREEQGPTSIGNLDAGVTSYEKFADAQDAARQAYAANPGGHELVPVRLNPFGGRKDALDALIEESRIEGQAPLAKALGLAVDPDTAASGPGPWGLVPRAAASQLRDQMGVISNSTGGKVGQAVTQAFRKAVLATSPKWLTGNVVEAQLRLAVRGAGPRSWMQANRVMAYMERQADDGDVASGVALDNLRLGSMGGTHFSFANRTIHRGSAEQWAGTKLAPVAQVFGTVRRTPGPKWVGDLWGAYSHLVFDQLNGRFESWAQKVALGQHIRTSGLLDGQTIKLSDQAVRQAAEGLKNTPEQIAAGRAVDITLGKYGKWGPEARKYIALYTPFVAWTINAVYFAWRTMPRDHPVLTSLIASYNLASEEWRKKYGLDLFMDGGKPGFLQGSIPGKNGSVLRLSRFTPMGAFTDLGDTAGGAVLPQIAGVQQALKGRDWKGDKVKMEGGREPTFNERALLAARSFVGSTVPLAGQIDRLAFVKKGPLKGRLRQELDPFKYTPAGKGARGGTAGGGGGSSEIDQLGGGLPAELSAGEIDKLLTP